MTAVIPFSRVEAAHLVTLLREFDDVLERSAPEDTGLRRLSPAAYPDDGAASQEYRRLTEADALRRRRDGVAQVLATLSADSPALAEAAVDADPLAPHPVRVDADSADAWLRTLSALRLVLASRLGIETADDHDEDDPRFAVYDWIGFRLDELVRALS